MKNVLFIGCHFDDIERACGGTVKKLSGDNLNVFGLILTDTHYVRDEVVLRDKFTTKEEAQIASSILNYKIHQLDYALNAVPYNEKLVYEIRNFIEERNIDTVFTHWEFDIHPDHKNCALCTLSATRHIKNLFMYKSNFYDTSVGFEANFYIDVSSVYDFKKNALFSFKSEIKRKGTNWLEIIFAYDKINGLKNNVCYAESFKVIKYIL